MVISRDLLTIGAHVSCIAQRCVHWVIDSFEHARGSSILFGITYFCIKSYSYAVVKEQKSGRSDTPWGLPWVRVLLRNTQNHTCTKHKSKRNTNSRNDGHMARPIRSEPCACRKSTWRSSTSNDASLRQLPQLFQCDLDDKRSPKALSIFAHAFAVRSNLRPPSRSETNSSSSSPRLRAPKQASTPEG